MPSTSLEPPAKPFQGEKTSKKSDHGPKQTLESNRSKIRGAVDMRRIDESGGLAGNWRSQNHSQSEAEGLRSRLGYSEQHRSGNGCLDLTRFGGQFVVSLSDS